MLDSWPENFTILRTPLARAASTKAHCVSSIRSSADETKSAVSTPSSAGSSVSGRAKSPTTTSTPCMPLNSSAFLRVADQGPQCLSLLAEHFHDEVSAVARGASDHEHRCSPKKGGGNRAAPLPIRRSPGRKGFARDPHEPVASPPSLLGLGPEMPRQTPRPRPHNAHGGNRGWRRAYRLPIPAGRNMPAAR